VESIKQIALPTNFQSYSAGAFNYAVQIAQHTGATINILHSYRTPIIADEPNQKLVTLFETISDIADPEFIRRVEEVHDYHTFEEIDMRYHYFAQLDIPDIVNFTYQNAMQLLAIGERARTTLRDIFFGKSIGALIDAKPACPVLAVPEFARYEAIEQIVYATGMNTPDAVLQQLRHIGATFGATIRFLHVVQEETRSYAQRLAQFKQHIQEVFGYQPYECIELHHQEVDTALHNYIQQNGIDMICLLQRHKSILDRLFLNSITKQMAKEAEVPVLIFYE